MTYVDLTEAINNFFYIFGVIMGWLRSHNFRIGVIEFDLFTLAIAFMVFELIWWFVIKLINSD